MRPLARIGGGDLPTVTIDPKDPNVVYTASTVMWRTMDGGLTWSAVRGAPGGDDYQRIWINPNDTQIILAVADQGAVVSANRGRSWSNWYNQNTAAMYHVTTDNAFPYRVCSGQQDSGSACVQSRSDDGRITFHDWHPGQHPGIRHGRAGSGQPRAGVRQPADQRIALRSAHGTDHAGRTRHVRHASRRRRDEPQRPDDAAPLLAGGRRTMFYASNVVWKSIDHGHSWSRISPDLTRQTWDVPANAGKYASTVKPSAARQHHRAQSQPALDRHPVGGHRRRQHPGHARRRGHMDQRDAAVDQAVDRIFNIDAGHFDPLVAYAAANTLRLDEIAPHFYRTHDGGKTWTEINTGIAGDAVANTIREDPRQPGLAVCRNRYAGLGLVRRWRLTGSRCATTCRPSPCAICRSRTMRSAAAPI